MFVASYRNTEAGVRRARSLTAAPKQIVEQRPKTDASLLLRRVRIAEMRARAGRAAAIYALSRSIQGALGPSWKDLVTQVAAWHGVQASEIMSDSRRKKVMVARRDAIVAVYVNCRISGRRLSSTELGQRFNRDHTTILHALRKNGIPSIQHRGSE
jgi:ferredoxin